MAERPVDLAPRGAYGIDAPYVPAGLGAGGLVLLAIAALVPPGAALGWAIGGAWMLASAGSYLYTTRAGKLAVWAELLHGLALRGDERVLDLGCGRGAVLLMAAKLVPQGRAIGVDLWSRADQSGNAEATTRSNAGREGVAERIDLHTADMRELPFEAGSFDVVVSSLAIHNIPDAAGRRRAIDEAMRVLRPGGRLVIADFRATREYAARLRELGAGDVRERGLGPRFWYGGPYAATKVVTATKAAAPAAAEPQP